MNARELPLAIVRCCTAYVVSMGHAVPKCRECGLTPQFERETDMVLTFDELNRL